MHISRFIILTAVLSCFSLTAEAQYTSRSSQPSGGGSKAAAVNQPAPAAVPRPTAQGSVGATTPSFTTNSSGTTRTAPVAAPAAQQAAPAARPQFRPRPAAAVNEEADDVPSFAAFDRSAQQAPATQQAQQPQRNQYAPQRQDAQGAAAAQGSNLPPPIVKPKGEVWVYVADFQNKKLRDLMTYCEWKVVLQNRTDTPIQLLNLSVTILDFYTEIDVVDVPPREASVSSKIAYTDKCPAMGTTKPKIEILACRIGDISNKECDEYIVIK